MWLIMGEMVGMGILIMWMSLGAMGTLMEMLIKTMKKKIMDMVMVSLISTRISNQ